MLSYYLTTLIPLGILAILSGFMDLFSTSSNSIPSPSSSYSFLRHRETIAAVDNVYYHHGVEKLFTRTIKSDGARDADCLEEGVYDSDADSDLKFRLDDDDHNNEQGSTAARRPISLSSGYHFYMENGRQILSDEDNHQPRSSSFERAVGERARLPRTLVDIPELPRFSLFLHQLSLWMNRLRTLLSIDKLLLSSLMLVFVHHLLAF